MQLEIKHIIPYFNYDLEGFLLDTHSIIHSIQEGRIVGKTKYGNNVPIGDFIKDFKPILRPLSDLSKELYRNGNFGFIPSKILENKYLNTCRWGTNTIGTGILDKEGNMVNLCFMYNEIVGECPYMIYQNLCDWHFDIFNLIAQGLALDINTLSVE